MVCEASNFIKNVRENNTVLILVLMEDGLRVSAMVDISLRGTSVLILVLMEDGLRDRNVSSSNIQVLVLILVLMEDGLRGQRKILFRTRKGVLILVLMEDGLRGCQQHFMHF